MALKPRKQTAALTQPFAGICRAARLVVIGLIAIGIAAAWHWRALLDPVAMTALIERYPAAPFVFLAVHVAASLLFIPRTLLAIVAGILFGMWWGVLWAAIGSVAGGVAGFLVARYVTSDLIDRRNFGRILDRATQGGWRMVALLRLIPIMPHSLANYGLGLTRVPLGAYAFGSLLGQLPMTVAYVDLGAAGKQAMLGAAGWLTPTLIGVSALALSLLAPAMARRRWRRAQCARSSPATASPATCAASRPRPSPKPLRSGV